MSSLDERFGKLGVCLPRILLPAENVDLFCWSVIACDQHTSEPEYWSDVEEAVGAAPSTFHLVLPEAYLGAPDEDQRIKRIHRQMEAYLDSGILVEREPGFVLTVRQTTHVEKRRGLMMALDLEMYDFEPGSTPLIRTTERTIMERIPPRVRVRKSASVELPHVIVLLDDADDELFGGLVETDLPRLYETKLMLGGGSVSGYGVSGSHAEHVANALESLASKLPKENGFLFAVGDGNHSLATAKVVWEAMKASVPKNHPARYALVEVMSLYDPGLQFEPIHRLIRVSDPWNWIQRFAGAIGGSIEEISLEKVGDALLSPHCFGFATSNRSGVVRLPPGTELPVAVAQEEINLEAGSPGGEIGVDYIHGWDNAVKLGTQPEHLCLVMPPFDPGQLFPIVARRGVLPRKAFSLGESEEKRYYLEARRISAE